MNKLTTLWTYEYILKLTIDFPSPTFGASALNYVSDSCYIIGSSSGSASTWENYFKKST